MSVIPRDLVAMASVKDVDRSIAFYRKLGFKVNNTFVPADATRPTWAWLEFGTAKLMVTTAAEEVVPSKRGVLFYIYYDDIDATRAALIEAGLEPGLMAYPFFAPKGEFRLVDPDGYCLMLTHF